MSILYVISFDIFERTKIDLLSFPQFHLETKTAINASSVKVVEDGPLRSSLEITYHFGQSVAKTILSLDALPMLIKSDALSMLRFETTVDWHERNR